MPHNPNDVSINLMDAEDIRLDIFNKLKFRTIVVGSMRRNENRIYDIDFLVISNSIKDTERKIKDIKSILFCIKREGKKLINGIYVYKNKHIPIDFFFTTKEEYPYALLHYTGPKSYNIRLRRYVKIKLGFILNQYGIFYANDPNKKVKKTKEFKTEKEIINFLGTTFYTPKDRK